MWTPSSSPGDGRAIHADRIRVGGTVRLHDFTARGEVRLLGARIDGSINLTGARLADADGVALGLDDAAVGGSVLPDRSAGWAGSVGRRGIAINSGQIAGRVVVRDATITASDRSPGRNYADHERAGGRY